MSSLDWTMVIGYFFVMLGIGLWAKSRIKSSADFFTAGGKMPWWLSGISHHMSGYSAAVFVGYAAIAYTEGFVLYIWWALGITFAMLIGSFIFVPRWPRLRQRLGIISPLEYLKVRFNIPTQQVLAWSGTALKVFDVGAKWVATAIILNVFTGVPLIWGILLTGGVTLIYSTIGGLWADALTDFGQFVIQFIAAIALAIAVMARLDGPATPFTMWSQLPPDHAQPFNGQYTVWFVLVYLLINTLSYNGGTWNLAQRFIASPTGSTARKAAWLSMSLYLVWPLVMFFPMWAAPLILPDLADPSQSYALLTQELLPAGLVGLVLAGIFAHTMAMTGSDAGAIAAVVTRDILPVLRKGRFSAKTELNVGRLSVFLFILISMLIALFADNFGGVLGLIITWFGGLVGPIAIPMLFGMLPFFRRSGPTAAIGSWGAGVLVFVITKFFLADQIKALAPDLVTTINVGGPVIVALIVFWLVGVLKPEDTESSNQLIDAIANDDSVFDGLAEDERQSDEIISGRSDD